MIKNSFIFLEKISTKKEQSIRKQGVKNWQDFLKAEKVKGIAKQKKYFYDRKINEAQQALMDENYFYFTTLMPSKENWRLYNHLKDECCFLDIEINGKGKVVVVGISDYYNTKFFVKGANLAAQNLRKELKNYKLVITFNGASFDLPKLKKEFNLVANDLQLVHLDLKPLCVNLGWKGGLKEVEKKLRLKRPQHLYGNPINLWKAFHASGDKEYLDLLLDYNREDIENLKLIADNVYRILSEKYLNNKT